MKRFVFLLIPLILLLGACSSPAPAPQQQVPTPTETPTQEPATSVELKLLKEWRGSGIKTTEPFTITKQPWNISWSSQPEIMSGLSVGMLQIMVYDVNNPSFPLTIAANTNEASEDSSFVYNTGTFYLTINAANTQWAVWVWAIE